MIFALGAIQFVGRVASRWLNVRAGVIISGFVNGLISSTALTASLSKKSKSLSEDNLRIESLSYLSATLAMLVQGFFLVLIGINKFSYEILALFGGPILVTLILLAIRNNKLQGMKADYKKPPLLDILSLIKLAIFIVFIIAISRLLQLKFGKVGLDALTFLVSLFEIHGAIIANTQLYVRDTILLKEFCTLVSIGLAASYIGKLVLIWSLGSSYLRKRASIWSIIILISVFISWGIVTEFLK